MRKTKFEKVVDIFNKSCVTTYRAKLKKKEKYPEGALWSRGSARAQHPGGRVRTPSILNSFSLGTDIGSVKEMSPNPMTSSN